MSDDQLKDGVLTHDDWARLQRRVTREDLRESLEQYSREPFADLLSQMIAAAPTQERLIKWSAERPGDWANAIKVLALLSGYTEKTESVQTHRHLHLHKMSDAELLQATQGMIDKDPSLLNDLRSIDASKRRSDLTAIEKADPLSGTGLDRE